MASVGMRREAEVLSAPEILEKYRKHRRRDFSNILLRGERHLRGADLSGSDFTGASLPMVEFRDAKLQGVNFTKADLSNAMLRGADLSGAILKDVREFQYADVRDATFLGADLTGARLNGGSHWQISALFESALERDNPTDEQRRERMEAIAFMRGRGQGLCWDGLVKHFRRTAPQSLIWGMRLLKTTNLRDDTRYYDPVLATIDATTVGAERMEEGTLSQARAGDTLIMRDSEDSYDDPYYTEVTVKEVFASGAILVVYDDDDHLFDPNGHELANEDSDLRLVHQTQENMSQVGRRQLLERFEEGDVNFNDLTTDQLLRIAAIVDEA